MHTHVSSIMLLLLLWSSLGTEASASNWGEATVINKTDTVHWAYTATRQTVNRSEVSRLPLVAQNCLFIVNKVYSYARFMHSGGFSATTAELSGFDSSLLDPPKWKYLLSGPWHKKVCQPLKFTDKHDKEEPGLVCNIGKIPSKSERKAPKARPQGIAWHRRPKVGRSILHSRDRQKESVVWVQNTIWEHCDEIRKMVDDDAGPTI